MPLNLPETFKEVDDRAKADIQSSLGGAVGHIGFCHIIYWPVAATAGGHDANIC